MVQVGVAHRGAGLVAGLAADLAVPTAVGDTTELFDVDMDQITGLLVLVAVRVRTADRQAGGLVEVGESGHMVAAQHRFDGRCRQVQVVGDAVRTPSAGEAQADDAAFGAGRGPVRTGPRARGSVLHRSVTGEVAVDPLLDRRRRALEAFGGPAQAPAGLDDEFGQGQSTPWRQIGVSVCHEDLSVVGECVVTTPIPQVLTYLGTARRSQPAWELQLI